MLTTLLRADEMQYIQTPVFSNLQLRDEILKLEANKNIRSVLFINCGGMLDHTKMWYYKPLNKIELFIFDSHRPFNHNTLIDPLKKTYVIHDGCKSFDEYPTKEDEMIYQQLQNELEDSEEDDYDSEDENEDNFEEEDEVKEELENLKDSDDEGNTKNKGKNDDEDDEDEEDDEVYGGTKVQKPKHQSQDDDEEAEVVDANQIDDEDTTALKLGQKRPRDETGALKLVDKRKLKRQKRQKFRNYYSGQFFHKSCSYLMYQVCQAMNRENKDMLWLWIVGMTDLRVHYKHATDGLDEDMSLCDDEVQRLNPNIYNRDNEDDIDKFNDDDEEEEQKNSNSNPQNDKDLFKLVSLQSRNKEVGTITMEQELKLMLLRHWSFYESLFHSNYVVSKLTLWKEPGKKDLNRFLAQLGISIEEAKQSYQFMDPVIRNELKTKILENCHIFALDNIMQKTYMLQLDHKTQILATDMAYSVTTILESPKNLNIKNGMLAPSTKLLDETGKMTFSNSLDVNNLLSNRISGVTLNQSSLLQKELETREHIEYLNQCKYDNFYVALDSLDRKNKHLLEKGIELAKDLQKAIIQMGTSILDKKQVKLATRFRYAFLDNDQFKDIEMFQFPLALQKLALFLMETYQQLKPSSKMKPFVISVRNNRKGTTLICAVLGQSMEVDYRRNNFSDLFRQIIESKNIKAKHDAFDSSIIEIRNEDFRPFVEELVNTN
eukprot:403344017